MGWGILGFVSVLPGNTKSHGVGLDGGGVGGLHRKLQAWVHRAVEGVLGWGGTGAQCRAGQVWVGDMWPFE